jgi:microcystin-dependent protein
MEPFVGEIRPFAFSFVPSGYLPCDGRLLPISQYSALFAIVGVRYGGNGTSNFALPNLQGAVTLSQGKNPSGSEYVVGEASGVPNVTLLQTEMPLHNHGCQGAAIENLGGLVKTPTANNCYLSNAIAKPSASAPSGAFGRAYSNTSAGSILNPATITIAGGSQPHNNMMPYLVINYGIAYEGIFPSRP